jgi:hypothetical protein
MPGCWVCAGRTRREPWENVRRRTIVRTLLVVLASVTAVPDALSTLTGRYCADWSSRSVHYPPLSAEDLYRASGSTAEAVVGWLPASFDGLAVPGLVLYSGEPDAGIWLHEMTHQSQMRREGLPRFAALYAWDWLQGRYHGCGPLDAYRSVRFEREAHAVAHEHQTHMWWIFADGAAAAVRAELRHLGTTSLRPEGFLERVLDRLSDG